MGILTEHWLFVFLPIPTIKRFYYHPCNNSSQHALGCMLQQSWCAHCCDRHIPPAFITVTSLNQLNFMLHDPGTTSCLRKNEDVMRGTSLCIISARQPLIGFLETKLWPRATFDTTKNIDILSTLLAENLHKTNLPVICTHTIMARLSPHYDVVYLIVIIFISLPLRISGKLFVNQCFDSFE